MLGPMAQPKFMDPEVVKKLLEGQENVFADRLVFGPSGCPACGGVLVFRYEGTAELKECVACGHAVDPRSGAVLRVGSPAKTKDVGFRLITPPSGGSGDPR